MARSLKEDIKKAAYRFGADLVGVTTIDRLEGAPEGHRAIDIMPSTRSVVVMGVMLPRGISDCWKESIFSYLYYGYIIPNKRLGAAAFDMALLKWIDSDSSDDEDTDPFATQTVDEVMLME